MLSAELEVIQTPSTETSSLAPLVLIHDGGGTIFQYYLLDELDRRTYGIANPYFDSDQSPAGGIGELARTYIQAIRGAIPNGRFILGGWSLGGLISLEVSRLLQNDLDLQVIGLILIDSFCPWSSISRSVSAILQPSFRATTAAHIKAKVTRSFDQARSMLSTWECPPPFRSPPAILIRAREEAGEDQETAKDLWGWSEYKSLQVVKSIDLKGTHFSIFEGEDISKTTESIRHACGILDTWTNLNGR